MAQPRNYLQIPRKLLRWKWRVVANYWRASWWHKFVMAAITLVAVCGLGMYSIAVWYQHSQKGKPQVLGVSFVPDYATYLGLDAHQTYGAILDDLHVKHLRLVSYWSDIEPTPGSYNFSELDYEMEQAQAHGAVVSLSIGLRQPRWPECHAPSWVDTSKLESTWTPQLNTFITTVVNRYKNNPALQSYQLENEALLQGFGTCTNFDRDRLIHEFSLVQRLDSKHPVIMTRSNNWAGLSVGKPVPDISGISVYRRVFDGMFTHRYITYPFPSWYYAFLAGGEQILHGKPSILHELQAEPWSPPGQSLLTSSLQEQNKSFDAARLQSSVKFGEQTGLKQIDLWGAEYWYYRAQTLHDPSVWNTAKTIFSQ